MVGSAGDQGRLGLAALAPAGPPAWVVEARARGWDCSDSACICIWFAFACQSQVAKDSPAAHTVLTHASADSRAQTHTYLHTNAHTHMCTRQHTWHTLTPSHLHLHPVLAPTQLHTLSAPSIHTPDKGPCTYTQALCTCRPLHTCAHTLPRVHAPPHDHTHSWNSVSLGRQSPGAHAGTVPNLPRNPLGLGEQTQAQGWMLTSPPPPAPQPWRGRGAWTLGPGPSLGDRLIPAPAHRRCRPPPCVCRSASAARSCSAVSSRPSCTSSSSSRRRMWSPTAHPPAASAALQPGPAPASAKVSVHPNALLRSLGC